MKSYNNAELQIESDTKYHKWCTTTTTTQTLAIDISIP